MAPVHVPGCDRRHSPRQRCNAPAAFDTRSPTSPSTRGPWRPLLVPTIVVSHKRRNRALALELTPIFVAILGSLVFGALAAVVNLFGWHWAWPLAVLELLLVIPYFAAGFGWMYVDQMKVGCVVIILRAITVLVFLGIGFRAAYTVSGTDHGDDVPTAFFLLASTLAIPLGSAVLLRLSIAEPK